MSQVSTQEFQRLPLRVHRFLAGVPLHEAVAMASTNPARALGLTSKGKLEAGADADDFEFALAHGHVALAGPVGAQGGYAGEPVEHLEGHADGDVVADA